ncbi:MAG: lipopolysaccharide biosynthesis protein [Bacteroidales bacterium]|nr:lipopolysaccharide biosynthesis protein [Bacteroidales bacterium]
MSLKQKAVSGFLWSFIDSFTNYGLQFVFGIILARLLTPNDYGLIGIITIFITISQSFIDSGFRQALLRKQDCTQADYSTVFFFNLAVSLLFYIILYIFAPNIGTYFNEPVLKLLLRVLGINLILYALIAIQLTILVKNINFKHQTKISIVATIISGITGITFAYYGYGVWSLIIKMILSVFITFILLWIYNKWRPSMIFSKKAFHEMFSFGSKLLLSGLLYRATQNIYYLVIGKYFTATQLGYYTRAEQFSNLPSANLTSVIERVSYPVLASLQHDIPKLQETFKSIVKSTMLISFTIMIGMAAIAKPLILVLIGEKWLPSSLYLQLLCIAGIFYPLNALNLNLLNVFGRSDLFLRLELIKTSLTIPIIIIGVFYGIIPMLLSIIIFNYFGVVLNSYYTKRYIRYSTLNQIKDIFPTFLIAFVMGFLMYLVGFFVNAKPIIILSLQVVSGMFSFVILVEGFKPKGYSQLKETIRSKFSK